MDLYQLGGTFAYKRQYKALLWVWNLGPTHHMPGLFEHTNILTHSFRL